MRKVASILLITMILLLTACSSGKITYVGDSPNVALIIANRGDKGFNDSAVIGLTVSERDHGTNLTILEHDNDPDKYEDVFLEAAKKYNHVVIASSMMSETFEKHVADYPDVKFFMYDGEVDWDKGNLENVYCVVFSANEVSYLAGYLASSMSKTGHIGFVGGMEIANILDFYVGYEAGAKMKNPNIKISSEYAGTFNDQEKGKEIAKRMADDGVDIIFSAAGAVGLGVLDVVAEKNLWMIGVDADQYAILMAEGKEDLAKRIITSATKNIGDVLYGAVDNYTKFTQPPYRPLITGVTKTMGLKEGGVSLSKNDYYKEIVPEEIQKEIDELEQKIIDGEIVVPKGRNEVRRPAPEPTETE